MKKLLLSALMLLSAAIVDKAYAQLAPIASSLTVAPETSTNTLYKWYTIESTNHDDATRSHLFLLYDTSHDPALYTVLLTNGTVDGVNLTSGGESIPDKYLWRLEQADGGVYLVNKASKLRVFVPSGAISNTELIMNETGSIWSLGLTGGNYNQYYLKCITSDSSVNPAYLNAMNSNSESNYGLTIFNDGLLKSSGWFFYKAYEEVVTEKTATPVLSLASGSNIQKGINEIGVTCADADAVIYYTTDGTEPTEGSAQSSNGTITIDATSLTLQDKVTVKAAAKATDAELSNAVSAEYVVYPYCYLPKASSTENWPTITELYTSRENGYDLNYTRTHEPDANYYDVVTAETSGLRVKKGETFDLKYMWANAWWSGFSIFMDKGTGTLEEIFYGCGAKDDIVADTDRGEVKLADNPSDPTSKSITIAADAAYGEYLLRTVVADTHDACTSTNAQKIVDIFYLVCPAITVNAADAAEGTVSVEADGASEQLSAAKTYLIPVGNPITLTAVPAEMYVFSKWVDANESELSTEATYTFNSSDNITVKAVFVPNDIDITSDLEETEDVTYAVVTLSLDETTQSEPVWKVGTHQTEAEELVIDVEADGATPEISIDGNGSISAQTIKVVRKITSDQWTLMSMPFTFNLSEVQVNGLAANYNDNIRIKEYDAALRANNSVDGYTASGWVEKTSGTISANEGFAIVVNPANGAEQTVTFTTTGFTMDANDKQITFAEQPSNANVINGKSMDSDWNLKGNPMLQSAEKGQGYTLYVHEAGTNTYRELSSTDKHTYSPFVAWFVQCDKDGGFMNLTFSHNGTSTYSSSMEDNITGRFDILINGGEDEARVTVLEGSSEMYERNEDAMYFAPLNDKISQLYLIDKEGAQIASSVVPAPYNEVKLAYNAAVAGAQTLTVTSVIPGTAVYLVDNAEGTETLMNEGSEYSFTSEAGLNSERFAVKTIIDVTGIEESTAETSSVSAVVTGDAVKIYGATAGETIDVYTVNGVMVSSAVAVAGENEITVPAQGVLIVKVGDEVVKIVK